MVAASAKRISSRNNPQYKALYRLCRSARERRKEQRTLLEGLHLVQSYVSQFGAPEEFILSEAAADNPEISAFIEGFPKVPRSVFADSLFDDLSDLASPTGLLTLIRTPSRRIGSPRRFILLLEDIQDPGNLGTLLRTAAGAGVECVFLSSGCTQAWSAKALRAAQGAHFHVDILEGADLVSIAGSFEGEIVGATPKGSLSVFDVDLRGAVALLIGNEGGGLSEELAATATRLVVVPMPGRIESLNAAVAAGVCLFEKVRQDAL